VAGEGGGGTEKSDGPFFRPPVLMSTAVGLRQSNWLRWGLCLSLPAYFFLMAAGVGEAERRQADLSAVADGILDGSLQYQVSQALRRLRGCSRCR
jgi:hypothetical protein